MRFHRVGTLRLLEILGEWSAGPGPLYRQLAEGLERSINQGDLRPGTILPSERTLASALAVSRTTVAAALREVKDAGYLDSAPGSGTWVRRIRGFNPAGGVSTPSGTVGRNPLFARLGAASDGTVDLTAAVLDPSPLVAETVEEAGRRIRHTVTGSGYHPLGLAPLRQMIAGWFTRRGLPTLEEEILVTSGAQQGLMTIAAAYIQPGDPVVVESPTYPGFLEALRLVGASVRTVPVHTDGLRSEDVVAAVDARSPNLVYFIPTFQNPTGTVMSGFDRRRLARSLVDRGVVVVEDESLVELSLDGEPTPPPFGSFFESTLIVGSASKAFWGGLRIGWIRGSEELIRRLSSYKTVFDLATSVPSQAAAALLLERSEPILAERRGQLISRRGTLMDALDQHLPDWEWTRPEGGLSIW
ncbi:MAG: PLP-dependent aminotransferase family protein, partial [Acidimicrobiia bacterium]